jgi:hypothetical protein
VKPDDCKSGPSLEETLQRLNAEGSDLGEPSPERAKELIDHQRRSQVPILVREMYGPILAPVPEAEQGDPGVDLPSPPRFEFKDSDRVAKVLLRSAAQVGASLRAFEPTDLDNELSPRDASLGRLLGLLSIAEEKPPDLKHQREEWAVSFPEELKADDEAPLGPVLTPMFLHSLPETQSEGVSTEVLGGLLVAELTGTDRAEELATWAAKVVEAGATAIRATGEVHSSELLRAFLMARQEELRRRPVHARDIVLTGTREENSFFLREVRRRLMVEKPTEFIHELEPGLVRLRAWSDHELAPGRFTEIANRTGAKVVEVNDDTVVPRSVQRGDPGDRHSGGASEAGA